MDPFSEMGPDVPSIWAKRLTRSSSIIQRTDWTSASGRRAGGSGRGAQRGNPGETTWWIFASYGTW